MQLNYEAAVTNRGNQAGIRKVFRRAEQGEELTIGFLGGSITQGFNATDPKLCYAHRVYDWWCRTFPKAKFVYVNAGIGATDSQFGCARVDSDLLAYRPDFVILEFSVNESSTPHYLETYEGLVRRICSARWQPAVLLVHNVCYDSGANAQLIHGKVARHYELPAVSMQSCIYPELLAGRLENRAITPDDLHPNDYGHELVASVITYFLEKMLADAGNGEEPAAVKAEPLTANAYQDSVRYRNDNASPVLKGFAPDREPQQGITDIFKKGWTASEKGASIVFEVEGSCIGVQYRKTTQLPAPVAELILDGDEEHPHILDANFDETWGDKLELDTVLEHGEDKVHRVEIRLTETHAQDRLPFYLVSVIGSGSEKLSGEDILFLNPVFTHNIWGGSRLREDFGYSVEGTDIGECWGISAHPNGEGTIRDGAYAGMKLSQLWQTHPEIFGNVESDRFPLLVKIIDAREDLSIQVHPDDAYAGTHENGSLGKTECWYVLDCPEGASLVIGHHARTREELADMIHQGRWGEFIREVPVKRGDFIQIDPGTVHAIKGGLLILETQQNSDITYRVYDYDRLSDGRPRQLHVEQSIDVITVPARSAEDSVKSAADLPANCLNELYSCKYYRIYKVNVDDSFVLVPDAPFLLATVLSGDGSVNGRPLKKGDHFLVPNGVKQLEFTGKLEMILSRV